MTAALKERAHSILRDEGMTSEEKKLWLLALLIESVDELITTLGNSLPNGGEGGGENLSIRC